MKQIERKRQDDTLSKAKHEEYLRCLMVLKKRKEAHYAFLVALTKVHSGRLYRQEYGSFSEFCRGELGFGVEWARMLVIQEDVWRTFPEETVRERLGPRHAAELVKLPKSKRRKVVQLALDRSGDDTLSVATIKRAIREVWRLDKRTKRELPEHAEDEEVDEIIEDEATQGILNRGVEFGRVAKAARELIAEIKRLGADETINRYLHKEDLRRIIEKLKDCDVVFTTARPHARCPHCVGGNEEVGCMYCSSQGWVNKLDSTKAPMGNRNAPTQGLSAASG
jgi:hypothetical protein